MRPLTCLLFLIAPATASAEEGPVAGEAPVDEDSLRYVLSLPTREDRVAWRDPGFRMELGYGMGGLWGAQSAPDADTHAALIRPGVRLDGPWSLYTAIAYAVASGGIRGAQYSLTFESVYHLTDAVRLGVGVGFGGILEGSGRPDPHPGGQDAQVGDQTLSSSGPAIGRCTGAGPAAVARLEWWTVLGPLSSIGLSFESGWQRTACEDDIGRQEPDTGEAIVRRQWWAHQTWRSSALFGWR